MGICAKHSSNPEEAAAARRRDICAVCAPSGRGHCPIGPELRGERCYNVVSGSIQVIERKPRGKRRWLVVKLFSGCRLDLRYPLRYFAKKGEAIWQAWDFGRHHLGGGTMEAWCSGDWIVRNGREAIVILVVRL